jgi:hypothetical protein
LVSEEVITSRKYFCSAVLSYGSGTLTFWLTWSASNSPFGAGQGGFWRSGLD